MALFLACFSCQTLYLALHFLQLKLVRITVGIELHLIAQFFLIQSLISLRLFGIFNSHFLQLLIKIFNSSLLLIHLVQEIFFQILHLTPHQLIVLSYHYIFSKFQSLHVIRKLFVHFLLIS